MTKSFPKGDNKIFTHAFTGSPRLPEIYSLQSGTAPPIKLTSLAFRKFWASLKSGWGYQNPVDPLK